jgi:hypothetical protein
MSKFKEKERKNAISKIKSSNPVFYGGIGGVLFMGKKRDFILINEGKNFYYKIYPQVLDYFTKNKIAWWGGNKPTGNVLSSQIACLNHLFDLRKDKKAVLSLLESVSNDFIDVIEIKTDVVGTRGYIQFEAVSDFDHLNERIVTRGSNCTSIDALIYAKHKDGSRWLILIEWKYTESYGNLNLAIDGCIVKPQKCKGKVRRERYTQLICASKQLKNKDNYCFYFEPFYQLMRQTLWAEQIIIHKSCERLKAENFLHIHVIPKGNIDLISKKYSCSGDVLETTWKNHLIDPAKYIILSPDMFLSKVKGYNDLIKYLENRYW